MKRICVAELVGTALLLAVIVGSGIMAERLSPANTGVALLANALATGAGLYALIAALEPVSGAMFNPVVTLAAALGGGVPWRRVAPLIGVQLAGAVVGVIAAHAMFGLPLVEASRHARSGGAQMLGELIATFGLILVIGVTSRRRPEAVASAVALYIVAAYWFTVSTSFANPAVTVARALTDTFAGIRPVDVVPFVVAQLAGGALAVACVAAIAPRPSAELTEP